MLPSSKETGTVLYCFSPPIMLFTFIVETFFALYVLVTGKLKTSTIVIIALLVCLGLFQLAEYQVCAGPRTLGWMRLGYCAITLLPPLGIHLVTLVTKHRWIRVLGYVLGAAFISYFLVNTHSISSAVCGGNYILIHTDGVIGAHLFPIYYDASMLVAILDVVYFAWLRPKAFKATKATKAMVYWLLGGYFAFLIPTGAVYLLTSAQDAGIPSVMCGFAILLAIILTLRVYPLCRKLRI